MSAPNREVLVDFATWLSAQTDLDVDTPEHVVDRYLEQTESETFLFLDATESSLSAWLYVADKGCWVCTSITDRDLTPEQQREEIVYDLAKPGKSIFRGFDDGIDLLIGRFGINTEPTL